MNNSLNTSNYFYSKQNEDKKLIIQFIKNQVEKGTGLSLSDLKEIHTEERLFSVALWHVTTTKKALCKALNMPVEAACRYKRKRETEGNLVQSLDTISCPFTKHQAHLLSTNPREFAKLLKSNTNQLNLFE